MQSFSKRLATGNGFNHEFFFNRIYIVSGVRYHVSVMDANRDTFFFNMEIKDNSWKIINAPKIPDWIVEIENKLEETIFQTMVGNSTE